MLEREVASTFGLGRRRPAGLVDEGVLVRLRRGVVVGACLLERAAGDPRFAHLIRTRALLLVFADCAASHESGAIALGLPTLDVPSLVTATRESGAWRGGAESRIRIAPLPDHHLVDANGIRCTSLERTVVDIARCGSLQESLVVGDAALRRPGVSPMDLARVLAECSVWADIEKARRALQWLDARSESPLESMSRGVFIERDFPLPELQVELMIDPLTTYRLDFFWRKYRVAGEADGMSKYTDPSVLRAEKVRQELIERFGITTVRWNYREMRYETDATLSRIDHAFGR